MECLSTENATETPIESKTFERREDTSTEEVIDRLQSKVQQYVRGADQQMLEHMRLTVFEVVVKLLRSEEFRGDIPKAVETACKAIQPLLKEISRTNPDVQEDTFEDPAEQDVSTPRSTSLMNQAAEGMRALGSFFAQAAIGGAEVSTLVREEEEAYHAEDIVYPLRRLAANEPGLDDTLVRQSSMYVPRLQFECNLTELLKSTSEEHEAAHGKKAKGGSIAGLSPGSSMELPAMRAEGGDSSAAGVTPDGDKLEGGDPGLMGGHTGPTAQGADYAQGAQDRAKAGREAQQRQLAAKTGDTLYPPSDIKEDNGRDGGTFGNVGPESATDAAKTDHIISQPASTHLQEENWDAPAQQSVTASVNEPGDVKGSRGHGDSDMPHAS